MYYAGNLFYMSYITIFHRAATCIVCAIFSTLILAQETLAANWTADVNNPNRLSMRAEYISRVDGVILRILEKGKDLQSSAYPTYINNVSKGITLLRAKPEYANNAEIVNIAKYISFELDGVSRSLVSNDSFFNELMQVIEETGGNNLGLSSVSTIGTTVDSINTSNKSLNIATNDSGISTSSMEKELKIEISKTLINQGGETVSISGYIPKNTLCFYQNKDSTGILKESGPFTFDFKEKIPFFVEDGSNIYIRCIENKV